MQQHTRGQSAEKAPRGDWQKRRFRISRHPLFSQKSRRTRRPAAPGGDQLATFGGKERFCTFENSSAATSNTARKKLPAKEKDLWRGNLRRTGCRAVQAARKNQKKGTRAARKGVLEYRQTRHEKSVPNARKRERRPRAVDWDGKKTREGMGRAPNKRGDFFMTGGGITMW